MKSSIWAYFSYHLALVSSSIIAMVDCSCNLGALMLMEVDNRRLHPMGKKKDDAELIVACNSRWSTPDGLHAETDGCVSVCVRTY